MCTIARINMHMTISSDAANPMDTANSDYEDYGEQYPHANQKGLVRFLARALLLV